jgi:hypothetical protein
MSVKAGKRVSDALSLFRVLSLDYTERQKAEGITSATGTTAR